MRVIVICCRMDWTMSRRRSSRWGLLRGGLSLTNWCFFFRRWNRFRVLHCQSFPKKAKSHLGHSSWMPQVRDHKHREKVPQHAADHQGSRRKIILLCG